MALIKCPECGLSISDKAAACPNCGYPLRPAPEPVEYELTRSNPSESKIGKFLRACVWVDGIVLIIWTIVIIFTAASTTYTRKAFDWSNYFTTLITYALYGALVWSVASLFDDVHNISTSLSSLQLSKKSGSRFIVKKDLFPLGSYPQTDDGDVDSPIVWQVLAKKGDKALLISQYALESLPYNADGGNVAWENCSLRSWLNDEFFNRAFSSDEKAYIIKPDDASKNPDNVFLLSSSDAKAYFHGDSSRVCLPTDYANSQGIHLDEQSSAPSSCYWWLRSSGADDGFAECVCNDGSISSRGYEVGSTGIGVRPCIWVLLS